MIYIPQNLPFLVYSTAQFLINLQAVESSPQLSFKASSQNSPHAHLQFLLIIPSPRRLLIYFLSINLPVPDMSYRWNLTLCRSLCLTFTWAMVSRCVSTLGSFGPGESAFPCMEMPCFVYLTWWVFQFPLLRFWILLPEHSCAPLCGHVFSFSFLWIHCGHCQVEW